MSRPFTAPLPRTINAGDKIILKGLVREDANEFSINFASENTPNPCSIVYHFKTILKANLIVENSKYQGSWMDEQTKDNEWINGQHGFAFEFVFQDDYIYTYWIEDNARNLISYFPYGILDFSEATCIQVWGDVQKISELSFIYA